MSEKLHVGIDLDGVVYDFTDSFRRHLGDPTLPEPDRWEMWVSWGMSYEEWHREFVAGIESGVIFGTGEPHEGAVEALRELAKDNFIHIVTHRDIHVKAFGLTAEWLHEVGIPYTSLTFSKDKTIVPTDIFLEDNVDNAKSLEDFGTVAILMDRAWNRYSRIERVSGWPEFRERVEFYKDAWSW
ncbi:5' nucleotidase [Mycobacterium phage Kumao]|uniref:5' nucleotidase n=1 Tax=Mycobacterium phage Kumao TaxID=2041344 RepID=A0A2D1GQ19_9CAUD|nr:5' nucleotidase [Mycobacterium phage Kumao]ATN94033.1 5' nucleotidase [Mycobacterium phage Kumao]